MLYGNNKISRTNECVIISIVEVEQFCIRLVTAICSSSLSSLDNILYNAFANIFKTYDHKLVNLYLTACNLLFELSAKKVFISWKQSEIIFLLRTAKSCESGCKIMFQYIMWTRAASSMKSKMFYLEQVSSRATYRLPIKDLHGPDFDGPARLGPARPVFLNMNSTWAKQPEDRRPQVNTCAQPPTVPRLGFTDPIQHYCLNKNNN